MLWTNRFAIPSLLLAVIVGLLGYYNYEVWVKPFPQIPIRETPKKAEARPKLETPSLPLNRKDTLASSFIQIIAEKNVFSPERKEFAALPGTGDQARPITRPQVVLYGVLIGENTQMATIVNPGRPLRKGEREPMTLKVGDRIGEYKLVRVMPDRIVLEAPGDSFEVPLVDPKAPKKRIEVRTTVPPAAVTSIGPSVPGVPGMERPPAVVPGTPGLGAPTPPGVTPTPYPRPVMPSPMVPSTSPTPMGPTPQMGASVPMSGPTPPGTSLPDSGVYRGRRFIGPGTSPESR